MRELCLTTEWTDYIWFGDELVSMEEFIVRLFGRLPSFFDSPESLRAQWEHPTTRQALLDQLSREGFAEEKLEMVRRLLGMEKCDMFDILEYLAFATTPMERKKRVEIVRKDYYQYQSDAQKAFLDFLMKHYVLNGYKELSLESLPTLLNMQYKSLVDATRQLGMNVNEIRDQYLDFQRHLYRPLGQKQAGLTVNIYGNGSTYNDNSRHYTIN